MSWLSIKKVGFGALFMAIQQSPKMVDANYSSASLIEVAIAIVCGGLFWGVMGTFVYNLLNKKP